MKAGSRFAVAALTVGLLLGPMPALAQNAAQPATNAPAPETIGPRELQDFSLNGTVTRPAETPSPTPRPQTRQPAPAPTERAGVSETPRSAGSQRPAVPQASRSTEPTSSARASAGQALGFDMPGAATGPTGLPDSAPQPGFSPEADSSQPTVPVRNLPLWPWLALAAVVGAAAAFLLWRRRSREALAGGPVADAYIAPEPAPQPPQPAPPQAPALPAGIVSTRLRPWVDLAFAPISCVVDEEQVTIEFEIQLYNSGSAPARDILVEASLFNAGATQDQDIGAFFAKPAGEGERIPSLPPLQRMTIRNALVAPRANIQQFELGGRQVFVPLVAFNALYVWGGGKGQTSASYLLGRETKGEKLGPLRADLGPRAFTGLGIRPLPGGVRK